MNAVLYSTEENKNLIQIVCCFFYFFLFACSVGRSVGRSFFACRLRWAQQLYFAFCVTLASPSAAIGVIVVGAYSQKRMCLTNAEILFFGRIFYAHASELLVGYMWKIQSNAYCMKRRRHIHNFIYVHHANGVIQQLTTDWIVTLHDT